MASDSDTRLPSGTPERDDSAQDELRAADTKGNSITAGNVSGTGIAIGPGAQANVIFTEEQAYKVDGLDNPYLGLRAFTAAERDIFAGRERYVAALVKRLSADTGDRLLFIVGASGSGKSSLARAGLLPALADQLRTAGRRVDTRTINAPGPTTATDLDRILSAGILSDDALLHVVLIDQFEGFFTQVDASERACAFDTLATLVGRTDLPLRIVATMRSDFLPHLVADVRFEAAERQKVVLRAMTPDELHDAIQRPIQIRQPQKRFEPALVERLAHDAAQDPAYLPMLQVTLDALWRGGVLRLGAYHGLADAIQRRADAVYCFRDYDELQQKQRTPEEQAVLLALLLDLVRVTPGTEAGEVRWQRSRAELTYGDPLREQLVDDLATARLLRTDQTEDAETVDLIHEALLTDWLLLKSAIAAERDHLHRRERFLLALSEWQAHNHHDDYLLNGVRLAEAEALQQRGERAVFSDAARALVAQSQTVREAARKRQLQRVQIIAALLGLLLIAALIAVGWAANQTQIAQQRANEAQLAQAATQRHLEHLFSQNLATIALRQLERKPDRAILLAYEALAMSDNATARDAMRVILNQQPVGPTYLQDVTGFINNGVFSPDGNHILTASADGTARLWDLNGDQLVSFQGHRKAINTAIFSPDGGRILTASTDGTARLWDVGGQLMLVLYGHTDSVTSAVFSPDGQRILTTSDDNTARLWDAAHGDLLITLNGHSAPVASAIFSRDGRHILTGSHDGTARLWDAATGNSLIQFRGHSSKVISASFSPDGLRILTASWDNTARVWDAADGDLLALLKGHNASLNSAIFNHDGSLILTASDDATARLWDSAGRLLVTFQHPTNTSISGIINAVFSQDENSVLTASGNNNAYLWSRQGVLLTTFAGHTSSVHSAVFGGNDTYILTTSADGTARLWDIDGTQRALCNGDTAYVTDATYSFDGNQILVASNDGSVRLWQSDGTLLATFRDHMVSASRVAFSADGHHMLTASEDETVRVLNAKGQVLTVLQGHTRGVDSAVFSPDGRRIVTASEDGTTRLWDLDGTVEVTLEGFNTNATFSPDGTRLLTLSAEEAYIWDLRGNRVATLQGHEDVISSAVFNANGNRILTASTDNTARLWDIQGNELVRFQGHTDDLNSTVIDPDSSFILTASDDSTARLWDVHGNEVARLDGHISAISHVAFSPDGQYILTASKDATVRLWDHQGQLISILKEVLGKINQPVTTARFSSDSSRILVAWKGGAVYQYVLGRDDLLKIAACRVERMLTEDELLRFNIPTPVRFNITTRQCPPKYSWEK